MPLFRYIARDLSGGLVRGTMVSETADSLYEELRGRGLYLIKTFQESKLFRSFIGVGIKRIDLMNVCFQVSTMLRAGVSITSALDSISSEVTNKNLRRVLKELSLSVEAGYSLSQAMQTFPRVFPPWFVNLVKSGEASGNLERTFLDISRFLEWQQKLADDIKQALFYPSIIFVAFILLLIFASTFLLPTLVKTFSSIAAGSEGGGLPLPAQILISFNDLLRIIWPFFIIIPATVFAVWKLGIKIPIIAPALDRVKTSVPIIGRIIRISDLSRFSRHFAFLYEAGIGIIKILELLEKSVSSINFSTAIKRMRRLVEEGRPLSQAASITGEFPTMLIQMFSVGEKTGKISEALVQVSDYLDRELSIIVKRVLTLLEPVVMLALSGMVGFLIITLVTTIYSMLGQIGR